MTIEVLEDFVLAVVSLNAAIDVQHPHHNVILVILINLFLFEESTSIVFVNTDLCLRGCTLKPCTALSSNVPPAAARLTRAVATRELRAGPGLAVTPCARTPSRPSRPASLLTPCKEVFVGASELLKTVKPKPVCEGLQKDLRVAGE